MTTFWWHIVIIYQLTSTGSHTLPAEGRDYAADRVCAMKCDAIGNLIQSSAKDPRDGRRVYRTEKDRLAAVADADFISHYIYDSNGDWTVKLAAENMNMDINASGERFGRMKYYTVYPSTYIAIDHKGYTKHCYAEPERPCSRLGRGGLRHLHRFNDPENVIRSKVNAYHYTFKTDLDRAGASARVRDLDVGPQEALHSVITNEPYIYFYHPDHLGSASWITNATGYPVQRMQYPPYGETHTDQHTWTYNARYTFTGKERDSETGYYYFGARYYSSDYSIWLSVDPMADKYPSLTPYNYCVWNPMKIVDPDGEEIWKPDEKGNIKAEKGDNAWTLASYLNTTPSIAISMLDEQGYFINSKGILNLKEGDVFNIDHGVVSHTSYLDLGKTGNFIRGKAGSGIAEDLFTNYWTEGGNITLSGSQFAGILTYLKENIQSLLLGTDDRKVVSFYESSAYSRAYGSATITIDSQKRITGFMDTYDFDPHRLGDRSLKNEIITRGVNIISKITGNGKGFTIRYP